MRPVLHIDLETRSAADLKKVGAHRYAEDPSTAIILASYRFDDGPVQRWVGEDPPAEVFEHVAGGGRICGHNQTFERALWNARIAGIGHNSRMQPEQQDCTQSRAAAMGLPHSLDNLGKALTLEFQKDKDGHALMLRMCKPRTKEPLTWHDDAADVARLAAYCDRDVETECAADAHLPPLSDRERRLWVLDQRINDRGFAVDLPRVRLAYEAVLEAQRRADHQMFQLTGGAVAKTSQVKRLVDWLNARGVVCESVADGELDEVIINARLFDDETAEAAVNLRRASAGAFKFEAMLRAVCADGRVRGSLQYHGTHGGRWAGRVVQPQNFKRVMEEDEPRVALALDLSAQTGDARQLLDALSLFDDKPLEVMTLLARPMIVAKPGHKLVDADFSNIEGRLNAWFAGEAWKLQAFRDYDAGAGPDLYKVTAAKILGKRVEDVTKSERQVQGKVPELACGYQGGVRAFQKMAAKSSLSITDSQARGVVTDWRETNPRIAESWYALQQAAIDAVRAPGCVVSVLGDKVRYLKPAHLDFLFCQLPSGRVISYAKPQVGYSKKVITVDDEEIELENFGVTFWGQKNGRWLKLDLYGGMQCAHIVSGTARDLLVEAMFAVEAAGYPIILTVHDELLSEVPTSFGSAREFQDIIVASRPAWAEGLPLVSAAWEDVRYVK
jgi:DNA polymerase